MGISTLLYICAHREVRLISRVLSFDPTTSRLNVLMDGLIFPNGVQISADGKPIYVAETMKARILKWAQLGFIEGEENEPFCT